MLPPEGGACSRSPCRAVALGEGGWIGVGWSSVSQVFSQPPKVSRVDHTAIGISNTDASLKFYRDLLGLRKAGESENFGTEQEHLNQVFGAHLQITGMRAASGPGIEFLEYLTPRDGRARPADVRPNDIVHWQTMIATDDVDLVAKKLRDAQVRFVSPGVVAMPKSKAGFSKAALVSDPDGHSVLLVQK